jgi:hypothetical protein
MYYPKLSPNSTIICTQHLAIKNLHSNEATDPGDVTRCGCAAAIDDPAPSAAWWRRPAQG